MNSTICVAQCARLDGLLSKVSWLVDGTIVMPGVPGTTGRFDAKFYVGWSMNPARILDGRSSYTARRPRLRAVVPPTCFGG